MTSQGVDDDVPQWNGACLVPLWRPEGPVLAQLTFDPHLTAREVDVGDIERESFTDTQTGAGKEHHERPVDVGELLNSGYDFAKQSRCRPQYRPAMSIDAELAAAAFRSTWIAMATAAPDRVWSHREPGVTALVTGLPIAMMNGVWVTAPVEDLGRLSSMIEEVRAHDLPYCLQGRTGQREALAGAAAAFALSPDDDVPLMVLDDPGLLPPPDATPGLDIRELDSSEHDLHTTVGASGFGVPVDVMAAITALVRAVPGSRLYAGWVDGVPATTAVSVPSGTGGAGIFNVATPPEHRRHGYGAAVTARAVTDAIADGSGWAWLQSSTDGYPVYQRIGFQTVEAWPTWVSATH